MDTGAVAAILNSLTIKSLIMKTGIPQKLFLLILLIFITGCDSSNEPDEPQLPKVTTTSSETQAVTTFTSVEITGAVDETNDEITSYGVVWATTPNPTIEDNVAFPGENSAQATSRSRNNRQAQSGDYTVKITNLTPGEMYYFRTFATNAAGTAYGEEISLGTESLAGTTWEITYLHSEDNSWIGHVTFHEDGTAFYTEPAYPGEFDIWGVWSMDGNMLTYDMMPNDDGDSYILTGELIENEMSGTYTFGDEEKPWVGELLPSE